MLKVLMVVKTHIELSALWVRGQKLNSTEILKKAPSTAKCVNR